MRCLVGRFLAGLLSGCLVDSMTDDLVGWLACSMCGHVFGLVLTMWQATLMMAETMAVMRGFLDDVQGARHDIGGRGKGNDATFDIIRRS